MMKKWLVNYEPFLFNNAIVALLPHIVAFTRYSKNSQSLRLREKNLKMKNSCYDKRSMDRPVHKKYK